MLPRTSFARPPRVQQSGPNRSDNIPMWNYKPLLMQQAGFTPSLHGFDSPMGSRTTLGPASPVR